ncbi:MAG: hypothetical protein U9R07_14080 [Pseudomonadota bacterium]|nr:hypothetical protein [Pseudomonadota bacterium]
MPLAKRDQFYGPANAMGLGSGLIVTNVAQPVYLPDPDAYGTGRGAALILTHECDIDPENIRPFSDKALIAPIIKLEKYIENFGADHGRDDTISLASHVAKGNTSRLFFLPRFGDEASPLRFGALIDFNYITSCGLQSLVKSPVLCSLSGYAISVIDRALQNHLFRPKVDPAPLPHG